MNATDSTRKTVPIRELSANTLLFLSSLLLLIDITPRDFLPLSRQRVDAVVKLRAQRNILGPVPRDVVVRPETAGMSISRDEATFRILTGFIRERSAAASRVDWSKVIGVGYSTVSVPVANSRLEAFRPLYLTLVPADGQERMELVAVGQLEDLDDWLIRQRQGSLTFWALVLLASGFLIQLYEPMRDAAVIGWTRLRKRE